jgi:ubiquinone/menaquinone biosynthesis C-methylase UbiE
MTGEIEAPLDSEQVRRIYDRIGRRYDLLRFAEAAPKRGALAMLAVRPGERTLEVGVGTGAVLVELARAATAGSLVMEGGLAPVCGIDLAPGMVQVARERVAAARLAGVVEVREGDARSLPYDDAVFDVAFSSFVLDLLPTAEIGRALAELRRVVRPGGRLALVALSPGSGPGARLFTAAYQALYRRHPEWLAGCRPIRLGPLAEGAGFIVRQRREWFRGHPSEALLAQRPASPSISGHPTPPV